MTMELADKTTTRRTTIRRQRRATGAAKPPSAEIPGWKDLIRSEDQRWIWQESKLIHQDQLHNDIPPRTSSKVQKAIVSNVYAAQNRSPQVFACLSRLLSELKAGNWGLNLGSGATNYHPQLINLDIQDSENVDVLNLGTALPFKNNSLDLVISQEVLEHIADPWDTISEVHRVLRPGGKFYCQTPFIIGFHPGPCDYWRFSRQALEHLFKKPQWERRELELTLGHGSGLYRILVEFLAVTASTISQRFYRPVKGLAALLCYPLQWFDYLTPLSQEQDRIPGGYYCVAVKQ